MSERRDCVCPKVKVKHRHGHWHAYANDRCRCQPCRAAWATYCRRARARAYLAGGELLVDPTGTARRLQALAVNGWTSRDLARELAVSDTVVREWMHGNHARISIRTRTRVAALYERLWDQPGPGRYIVRARRWALAQGYLPPLAWDNIDDLDETATTAPRGSVVDEVAVQRRIAGHPQHLTVAELAQAVLTLHGKGWSPTAIARHLRMSGARVGQIIDRDEAA